jgi:hypothetical protein
LKDDLEECDTNETTSSLDMKDGDEEGMLDLVERGHGGEEEMRVVEGEGS